MMRSFFSFILLVLVFTRTADAQSLRPGEWRTYTSMRSVADVALSEDSQYVWAATSGGAFRVKLIDRTDILQLRNSNGLSDNELTAVAVDASGNTYFGGRSGSLDIWSRTSGTIRQERSIMDIREFGQKSINDIVIDGDRVYLATGYGLTVYNSRTRAFGETVVAFGTFPSQEAVQQVIILRDTIYAVLSRGVAYTPTSTFNLNNPASWNTITSTDGTLSKGTQYLGDIYVGGDSGLKRVDVSLAQLTSVGVAADVPVAQLAVQGASMYLIDPRGTSQLGTTASFGPITWRAIPRDRAEINSINALALGRDGLVIAGTTLTGLLIGIQNGDSVDQAFPSGPNSNSVEDLDFAVSRSKLFTTHGDLGASVFDPEQDVWLEYPRTDPRLPPVGYRRVLFDSISNVAWFGLSGQGVMKAQGMETGNITYQLYDKEDGLPSSDAANGNYVIGGKGMLNNKGEFVATAWASDGRGLSFYQSNNTFNSVSLGNVYSTYGKVAQDFGGTYWVGTESNTNPAPYGLFFYSSSGLSGSLFGGPGGILSSASVNALVVDQDNTLWVGT